MTVLVRLFNKDFVIRKKDGRQFLYSVAKKKGLSPLHILKKVKTSLFGSEKLKPILGLLESDDELSREELQRIRKAIDEKLKEQK